MSPAEFESIQRYVEFSERDSALLLTLLPRAAPHFHRIVDDFYAAIVAHPDASAAITGGIAQVERLKGTLVDWLTRVLTGPYDAAYLARHANIGRVHVRIRLPQHFMFTAVNRIRTQLTRIANADELDAETRRDTVDAIGRVLDLELAVMLDSYRSDLVDQMRAQERLATVGEMAATVAHELRNPLGTIQSSLYLIQRQVETLGLKDPVLEKHHGRIGEQVEHCGATISNLLLLTKNRAPQRKRLAAAQVFRRAVALSALPRGISVDIRADDADGSLIADPDQLNRVLVNLLSNSKEALNGSGNIELRAKAERGGHTLSVKDDGPGVAPENRDRIFNALFTTKATGTGLGLGLCRKIVDAHHGKLEFVNEPVGAHFRVWLPDVVEPDSE